MTNNMRFFKELYNTKGPSVILADGNVAEASGYGHGLLRRANGNGGVVEITRQNFVYVPSLKTGLISVDKIIANGFFQRCLKQIVARFAMRMEN